ncbi:hypothetical protein COHA_008947 [Chlorella ohadii]|uniref:Fe2OG dioxygenase domain-containing protein n=1 Tax=Chlorella ohadii TaxID=2649997 RepID=A0AAD5DHX8_9CHLO|nr:hypothetical protein COHA_008947 [Chlorella ohadii]
MSSGGVAALPSSAVAPLPTWQASTGTSGPLAPWRPPVVDIAALAAAPDGAERLAAAIAAAPEGVLLLSNALSAPFGAIGKLFDRVTPQAGARASAAYQAGTSRLVWKDAHGEGRAEPTRIAVGGIAATALTGGDALDGRTLFTQPVNRPVRWLSNNSTLFPFNRGGPHVDYKRVIDLSPHRADDVTSADPDLAAELGQPLEQALGFFGAAQQTYGPLLLAALSQATGGKCASLPQLPICGGGSTPSEMVDYGARALHADAAEAAAPHCSAHRDFGPATLIWAGGEGLEVKVGGAWRRLPRPSPGTAVLLFGICTAWRSNERIPAAEHRVADAPAATASHRRLSAVLFVGLRDDALLAAALVSPEERPIYRTVRVGDVGPTVRRKWSWREGSVTAEEAAAEVAERALFRSQEELIAARYKLQY